MWVSHCHPVIPAQAGIQVFKNYDRNVSTGKELDSSLRWNDSHAILELEPKENVSAEALTSYIKGSYLAYLIAAIAAARRAIGTL